ncbi:MAG: ATP-binding protein [Planctomycetes bacterium]|nr:ATP-binding protein [Planctomycetota bacterium]
MNDLHALARQLEAPLAKALRASPVVVVSGARQTGKSTLVSRLGDARSREYLTLDDGELLERARSAPDALVTSAKRVTIDEVQRSPELLLAIKRAVDKDRTQGRFLLTGSADLLLMKRVSESLAGRALHLSLWPMTRRELLGQGRAGLWSELFAAKDAYWLELVRAESKDLADDWTRVAALGGFPTPAHHLKDEEERRLWYAGYVRTYLERDLRDLLAVSSLVDFRRLMRAICLRIGNLMNQAELGRDVGLSQPTVHRHLAVLEASYQVVRLEPYAVNRTKRLIKSPKLYWSDTGLALHLSGESEPRGAHLENLVLGDLLAWRGSMVDGPEVLYWRTSTGTEVDFVLEWKGRLLPIEVKATKKPRLDDAAGLREFREEYAKTTRAGLLLHCGSETSWLDEGILAVPWWRVL